MRLKNDVGWLYGVGDVLGDDAGEVAADVGAEVALDSGSGMLDGESVVWRTRREFTSWRRELASSRVRRSSSCSFEFDILTLSTSPLRFASTVLACFIASECARWFMRIARNSAADRDSDVDCKLVRNNGDERAYMRAYRTVALGVQEPVIQVRQQVLNRLHGGLRSR